MKQTRLMKCKNCNYVFYYSGAEKSSICPRCTGKKLISLGKEVLK